MTTNNENPALEDLLVEYGVASKTLKHSPRGYPQREVAKTAQSDAFYAAIDASGIESSEFIAVMNAAISEYNNLPTTSARYVPGEKFPAPFVSFFADRLNAHRLDKDDDFIGGME